MGAPPEALGAAPAIVQAWERCRPRPHLRAWLERCASLPNIKADSGAAVGELLRAARLRAGRAQLVMRSNEAQPQRPMGPE